MREEHPVAKPVAKIRAVAWTAFQETLRKRVFYVVLILTVLIGGLLASEMAFMRMASAAGETKIASSIGLQAFQGAIGTWVFATTFLALFLGSVGISSEISGKTIANVFSRPVERPVYLLGRGLGILTFVWAFLLIGLALALLVARIFDLHYTAMIWLGFVELFVGSLFSCAVSLGLSAALPPVLAGFGAFLLTIIPKMVESGVHHPFWLLRWLATAAYYAAPAAMPDDLVSESLTKELLHPDYALYLQVMGENLLYAAAVFTLACIVFSRRELKLR
jgi:ABC-2 family transporter protein